MKVEIPQILWNCEDASNKGLPTALMSLSLLPTGRNPSGIHSSTSSNKYCLATAGNCTDINIWSIEFPPLPTSSSSALSSVSSSTSTSTSPFTSMAVEAVGKSDAVDKSRSVVSFTADSASSPSTTTAPSMSRSASASSPSILKNAPVVTTNNTTGISNSKTKIEFLCSLTRHEGPVNIVAFSPNGQHLVSASDTGSIILWSVPSTSSPPWMIHPNHNLSNNNTNISNNNHPYSYYWTNRYIQKEADLTVKIISSTARADSIIDLSWSADSKRFVVGTIDHTIMIYEDIHYNTNHNLVSAASLTTATLNSPPPHLPQQQNQKQPSEFKMIFRNASCHTHFIQGVAFDPLQVYIASQSSDRTIRVWQRKEISLPGENSKKKNNSASTSMNSATNSKHNSSTNALATIATNTLHASPSQQPAQLTTSPSERAVTTVTPSATLPPQPKPLTKPQQHQLLLSKNKFDLQIKTKQIKYRTTSALSSPPMATTTTTTTNNGAVPDADMVNNNCTTMDENSVPTTTNAPSKHYLFAAETTLESFVRRLKWTVDGAYLIVPAATWSVGNDDTTVAASSKFATLIYQRHKYDEPYKVLCGHDKPSIAVCPNPVLFKLVPPEQVDDAATKGNTTDESKENCNNLSIKTAATSTSSLPPYRNVFAVLTWDSVLIYDTVHDQPLAIARGLHYANIVDASWTEDGHTLMVCSTDGYISILRFTAGELGEVHCQQPTIIHSSMSPQVHASSLGAAAPPTVQHIKALIPPCEPGSATLQNPPHKKSRITPSPASLDKNDNEDGLHSNSIKISHKRTASEAAIMTGAVHKLSLVETNAASSADSAENMLDDEENRFTTNPHTSVLSLNPTLHQSNDQYLTPPPMMKKQKKRIQPIQLVSQPAPQAMQN